MLRRTLPNVQLLLLVTLLMPSVAMAHQPRMVEGNTTVVIDPEVSKAYYATLDGEPHVYTIDASAPFNLYVNILVPAIAGQKKDVVATVIKNGDAAQPLAVLGGESAEWKEFFEPFGRDTYWMGPEYKAQAEAGKYEVRVTSANNDTAYSLAIGERESFNVSETMNALTTIPALKRSFFRTSPISFILSPFGYGLIIGMFILSFMFGFLYRFVLKTFAAKTPYGRPRNIGRFDRLSRAAIGIVLFVFAITTTWSPLLLFFSGFCFFEAIFSWCGFYAAIGKNSCPIG